MNHALILMAGGNARRFGSNKLLALVQGRPMFLWGLESLVQLQREDPFSYSVFVVTQHEAICHEIQKIYKDEVTVLLNPDCALGASWSLKTALRAVEAKDYTFVSADQPFIKASSLRAYFQALKKSQKDLGGFAFKGEIANPVTFGAAYVLELLDLEQDQGGKKVLKAHRDKAFAFEISDPLELKDIDSPADLAAVPKKK